MHQLYKSLSHPFQNMQDLEMAYIEDKEEAEDDENEKPRSKVAVINLAPAGPPRPPPGLGRGGPGGGRMEDPRDRERKLRERQIALDREKKAREKQIQLDREREVRKAIGDYRHLVLASSLRAALIYIFYNLAVNYAKIPTAILSYREGHLVGRIAGLG